MKDLKLDVEEAAHPASFAGVLGLVVSMLRDACILAALALVLALAFPPSANAATVVPVCKHDVAPVDVGLHARNVAASKVVKTWTQPKGEEITMKAKVGGKLVDVICRTAKEREYALDTDGKVYDTACGNEIVRGYKIPAGTKSLSKDDKSIKTYMALNWDEANKGCCYIKQQSGFAGIILKRPDGGELAEEAACRAVKKTYADQHGLTQKRPQT